MLLWNQSTAICFRLFAMIQTCTYLYSIMYFPQQKKAVTCKLCLQFSGLRMRNFTWNRFPIKSLLIDSLFTPIVESAYLNRDMCKFEPLQKDESRWQSTDSSKAYRNTSAFKCYLLTKNQSTWLIERYKAWNNLFVLLWVRYLINPNAICCQKVIE